MNANAAPFRVSGLIAGLGLGCATVLLFTSLGWIAVAAVSAPAIFVSIRTGRLDALGGYLVGLGLALLLVIVRLIAGGAPQDGAGPWVAFGFVALAIGALLVMVAARRGRGAVVPTV